MKTLPQLLNPLKLDYVHSEITQDNLTTPDTIGTVDKLFKFDEDKTSEEVIEAMKAEGYRLANWYEFLEWAEKEWNGTDWVVALGTILYPGGGRYVLVLDVDAGHRGLDLGLFGLRWNRLCVFAGVRVSDSAEPNPLLAIKPQGNARILTALLSKHGQDKICDSLVMIGWALDKARTEQNTLWLSCLPKERIKSKDGGWQTADTFDDCGSQILENAKREGLL
ncbi:MAG: hypothetical protein Q8P56_01045 [Candidatus Uhrbacteria bacterium]|nr:hypothetical protein [Candidatus Uhrbacteria bacterium]